MSDAELRDILHSVVEELYGFLRCAEKLMELLSRRLSEPTPPSPGGG